MGSHSDRSRSGSGVSCRSVRAPAFEVQLAAAVESPDCADGSPAPVLRLHRARTPDRGRATAHRAVTREVDGTVGSSGGSTLIPGPVRGLVATSSCSTTRVLSARICYAMLSLTHGTPPRKEPDTTCLASPAERQTVDGLRPEPRASWERYTVSCGTDANQGCGPTHAGTSSPHDNLGTPPGRVR